MKHKHRWLSFILCLVALCALASCKRGQPLRAEMQPGGVAIYIEDALFTFYRTTPDKKYPYFYPVNGPLSGKSLTTESSEPYPHHHSLFFGCDKVNGGNYWQEGLNRGQIASRKLSLLMDRGKKIVIENECLWVRPEAEPPFRDHRLITVTAPSRHLRLIELQITLTALADVRIENTNHALFSARMTPELSVNQGGEILNAEGLRGEKETWGKASAWCDYSGMRDGIAEGLAIMSHPSNRWFPEPWFTRDYGFFSPTPMNWLEDGVLSIAQGETIRLRYLTAAHRGNARAGRIEDVFNRWKKNP